MSKKFNNLKWESVALDGFPVLATDKFEGFVGLEECTNYGLDKENKRSKKKKPTEKRKPLEPAAKEIPKKKMKLSNGFIVEDCKPVTPSTSNEIATVINKNMKNKQEKRQKNTHKVNNETPNKNKSNSKCVVDKKKNKPKLGETVPEVHNLTPEDMLTWAEFKLPEEILKALAELGFKKPTKIQQLTLPPAIHGRRDILGAAETGSGKTLAFGIPILSGIMKIKEKAEAKGLDVYDIQYKKTSIKKKNVQSIESVKKGKGKERTDKRKNDISIAKESSEDGYSSDIGDNNEMTKSNGNIENEDKVIKSDYKGDIKSAKDDDYIEEIEVKIRKKEPSTDEGNESDSDSDNYIHLSEMLDSDDVSDSSDNMKATKNKYTTVTDSEQSDSENSSGEEMSNKNKDSVESGDENMSEDTNAYDEVNRDEEGIGCVKVIDNVDIPGHVVTKTGKPLYALILTPTRELAIQISRHLIAIAKYTGIKIATIVGGMAAVKQERVLRSGPEVVVATPGRLWELINQGHTHLQQLESVKFLAIDETDRMIERNHFEELQPLLERLNADDVRRATRQNFVFSATLTLVHDLPSHMRGKKVTKRGKIINRKIEKMTSQQKIKRLIDMIGMTDPKVVDITTENLGTAETLTECSIACSFDHKDAYLYYVLKMHPGRTIVFCNSIGCVKRLAQLFTLLKCRPLPLHASMPQRQRLKNLERFRDDPHGVLVATDVAARGLDIPNVDHVIHYQVPRTAENYVHRSGRTARANNEGLTILMMEPSEAYNYSKLCRTLNKTSVLPTFPVPGHLLTPMREIVTLARDLDVLELKKRRVNQSVGWREKAARDMDMIIDDDDVPVKQIDPSIDKALQAKRRQLDSMLSKPLIPKGFSYKYPSLNDANVFNAPQEKALQVMKNALESGEHKKEKRKGKNESLLKLEKEFRK